MNNKIYKFDAIVIGTGAAGYNAACRIKELGSKNVAIVTEGVNEGTSRNTGSDKQTYYKLGLGGNNFDSVRKMAQDLFDAGAVDGDNALCEAALSTRSFLNLCELGVEFPTNRYGEYIGYKTDHDLYARATSSGPLTSKYMTEALEKHASSLGIKVYDKLLAVEILKNGNEVCGLVLLDKESGEYVLFNCPHIVLATGGPAGIYYDSVYPKGHTGSSSLAIKTGAKLQNLTEWQYGLASVEPRWNVSGTYMQVLPRVVSVDENGNENEFLLDYFKDPYKALSMLFLKGYQWPFDNAKVLEGSSIIDLLVYKEKNILNRKVYLDYTRNPFALDELEFSKLSDEAYTYLKNADACFGKPIDRLLKMNTPAVTLYQSKGVDIKREYLEIALCSQHNNGGISVDMWWQTSVKGLFACGECAGTHGVTRPGGSALNSGQVGSLRAAQFISQSDRTNISDTDFIRIAEQSIEKHTAFSKQMLENNDNINDNIPFYQKKMSECAAAIRNRKKMTDYLTVVERAINNFDSMFGTNCLNNLYQCYKLYDILYVQAAVLTAMIDFDKTINASRGSSLYFNENGQKPEGLDDIFRFVKGAGFGNKIQELNLQNGAFNVAWRSVRPMPEDDDFFENVWSRYRENKNIY